MSGAITALCTFCNVIPKLTFDYFLCQQQAPVGMSKYTLTLKTLPPVCTIHLTDVAVTVLC